MKNTPPTTKPADCTQSACIVVTKQGLFVDGMEVQTRNRWHAKEEAARLSKERGVPWFSQKRDGKLVPVINALN